MKSQIHHEIDLTENELINLPAKLLEHSQIRPHDVAMRHKRFGIWKEFTWEEYLNKVRSASLGFYELGVREGDKVAIHSENRPEWVFADLGAQTLGSVSVGIYPTSPAAEVEYLLSHSEASVLIVEDEEQITMGQQTISLKFSADYVVNSRLNLKIFYDKVITNPFISTTYPGAITNAGFSLRFTLAG